jgi:hypothetical protein
LHLLGVVIINILSLGQSVPVDYKSLRLSIIRPVVSATALTWFIR